MTKPPRIDGTSLFLAQNLAESHPLAKHSALILLIGIRLTGRGFADASRQIAARRLKFKAPVVSALS